MGDALAPTLLSVLALLAFAWPFAAPLRRRWRRAQLARVPFPPEWRRIVRQRVPLVRRLPADLRLQLQGHIRQFLAEVPIVGCAGMAIDDEVRVTIAAQACLLLLGRASGFDGLREVLVYPGAFAVDRVHTGAAGVEHRQRQALAGESHGRGAVVLSWQDVQDGAADPDDGRNVVIHEFAHRLDQDNGAANGAPWLGPKRGYDEWARVLGAEYAALRARVEAVSRGGGGDGIDVVDGIGVQGDGGVGSEGGLIPAYGAIDPAEFFAVVSELYFERPEALKREHPALFEQFRRAYRTDPSTWV